MIEGKLISPESSAVRLALKLIAIIAISMPVMVGCHADSCRHNGAGLSLNHRQAEMCQDSLLTISKELIPYFDSFISECEGDIKTLEKLLEKQ